MEVQTKKKMGRPTTPAYAKKQFRYSGIETRFLEIVEKMENEYDKKLVLNELQKMRVK